MCLAWDCASHASYVRGTHGRSQSQTQTWPRGQNHLCWVQVTRIANQCTDRVLRLCSVVRSVFVQPIANYPLLIAENSDKISEERSQLWNSDRFFANNNKLIGTLLTANFQGMEEKLSSSTGKQNISTSKLFSHHRHNILIPHSIPSVCYQLLVPDKYISVVSL